MTQQTKTNVNILFDSGSQRTYISSDLRKRLKLQTSRTERIFIKSFGNKSSSVTTVDIVALKIINAQKIVTIEAICTPIICADLINQNMPCVTSNYPHLKGLTLADSSTNLDKRIDILIGSDYYYSIVSGEILKGKIEEPVAINSLLGWILCRPFENNPGSVNVNFNSVHNMRVHTETMSEFFFNKIYII